MHDLTKFMEGAKLYHTSAQGMDSYKFENKIIEEFHYNFPFLESDILLSNSSIKFISTMNGNYTGQVKLGGLKRKSRTHSIVDDKFSHHFGEINDIKTSDEMQFVRHGWGKMSWKNGTLYGNNLQFIYSDKDEYIGQWSDDSQNGKYRK